MGFLTSSMSQWNTAQMDLLRDSFPLALTQLHSPSFPHIWVLELVVAPPTISMRQKMGASVCACVHLPMNSQPVHSCTKLGQQTTLWLCKNSSICHWGKATMCTSPPAGTPKGRMQILVYFWFPFLTGEINSLTGIHAAAIVIFFFRMTDSQWTLKFGITGKKLQLEPKSQTWGPNAQEPQACCLWKSNCSLAWVI